MDKMNGHKIKFKVISQQGTCVAGHKVDSEFVMKDDFCPDGMCGWAFHTCFPFAMTIMYGGRFPWDQNPGRTTVACPDAENPVVFEVMLEE